MTTTTQSTSALSADSVLRRHVSPRLEQVEVAGETVVFDSETGSLHLFDVLATVIWTLLDGTATLRETSVQVARLFQRPTDEVFAHVHQLTSQLDQAGLVERVG